MAPAPDSFVGHNALYDFHDLALFQARSRCLQGLDGGPFNAPVARSGAKPDHRWLAPAITGSPVVVDGSSTSSDLVTQPVTSDPRCVTLPRIRDLAGRRGAGHGRQVGPSRCSRRHSACPLEEGLDLIPECPPGRTLGLGKLGQGIGVAETGQVGVLLQCRRVWTICRWSWGEPDSSCLAQAVRSAFSQSRAC